jgi:MazG family protein
MDSKKDTFERLLKIMDKLRKECPWDSVQTNETLRTLTIEETYELADAIIIGDDVEIGKELGDLLLHIVFYAKIGEEKGVFDIGSIIENLIEKLIYRHPHIFGDVKVQNATQVEENWEQLKLKEKDGNKSVLSGVPASLPAMVKANRIQDKARGVGFDWENPSQVWDKLHEEFNELKAEVEKKNQDGIEDEFGDLFFSLINTARLYGINPENALERTNKKFIARFNYLEEQTIKKGRKLKDMSLEEMDEIWNEAKRSLSK